MQDSNLGSTSRKSKALSNITIGIDDLDVQSETNNEVRLRLQREDCVKRLLKTVRGWHGTRAKERNCSVDRGNSVGKVRKKEEEDQRDHGQPYP